MNQVICRVSAVLLAACWAASPCSAQSHDHKMVRAAELKWVDVPSLPKGAQMAVIEGPMNEAVPFTVRLRFPANYRVPPHWHPAVERVTVLSGAFHMAVGATFDEKKVTALDPGDMMILQAKTPHYALTKVPTVVHLHGTGPWGITYLNPADDPRKQK